MEGFTYATVLDLNMGYYTVRLDPDSQKICSIILPWGKYSYATSNGYLRIARLFLRENDESYAITGICEDIN